MHSCTGPLNILPHVTHPTQTIQFLSPITVKGLVFLSLKGLRCLLRTERSLLQKSELYRQSLFLFLS